MIVFNSLLFHKGLDLRIAIPLLAFVLISANVHVGIREKSSHLTQKSIKKLVGLFAGWIESRLKNSCAALNFVRPRSAADFRVTNQPTGAVPRNIKLRHYSNATVTRISNDFAHLVLRIEETIGAERVEFGKLPALDAKALVLCQVPVKDVQFYCRHGIEVPFENFHRLVVTGDVDE